MKEVRQIDKEKPPGGTEADSGLTGLAVLAFLGAGYTHEEGNYAEVVSRAIRWLIDQQRSDGYLGGTAFKTRRFFGREDYRRRKHHRSGNE